jgi:hypothetical protein
MTAIQFTGKILPLSCVVTLDPIPPVSCYMPDSESRVSYRVSIKYSNVTVDCDCTNYDEKRDLIPVFIRAIDVARAPVDLFAFSKGMGFFLVLDAYRNSAGVIHPMVLIDEATAALATSVNSLPPEKMYELLQMLMLEPPFYRVFRDLNRVLTDTHVSAQYSFRAIEGVRHLLSPLEPNKNKSWERLRDVLGIRRSYIDPLTERSFGPRHGDSTHIPGSVQADLVKRAWTIVNRYIEFRLRGGTDPLPTTEFPELT